ncbi:lamin tail domain-containing protein [Lacinutrix sp.]|uniref:lamin tail domain-containing protein n=1 Tax=Lacinutrix sp. TaxID=1937692 RepID=UPI0025BC3E19|nr:lamin tail domain-containing protein [Lacinutrix sp.]
MKTITRILGVFFLLIIVTNTSHAQLIITEVQSSNSALTYDLDEYDWIEIYNSGSTDIDLTGYYISDDPTNPSKSELSATTNIGQQTDNDPVITPGEYKIVLCSNEALISFYDYFHTNFKLSSNGEEVHLYDPNLNLISSLVFPALFVNESYGYNTAGELGYFTVPTPEAENGLANFSVLGATLNPPVVDLPNQIFTATQQVSILSDQAGTIYYTLDGSNPTAASTQYTGSFSVNTTTVVKSILIQSNTGEISTIGMRTLLFNVSHQLGVLSITPQDYTRYGSGDPSGNYKKPVFNGRVWVELIEPDNSTSIAQYANYTASGKTSGNLPPLNGKLRTKEIYGDEVFNNQNGVIFPKKQHIEDVYGFIIKNASQDWNEANLRDVFSTALITENTLIDYGFEDNRRVVVYVNGEYQGVLSISEDDDDDFEENNYQDENIIENYDLFDLSNLIESTDITIETERNSLLEIVDMRDYYFFNFHLAYGAMGNETGDFGYRVDGEKADWIIHDEDVSFAPNNFYNTDFTISTPLIYNPNSTSTHYVQADDYVVFKEDFIQSWCTYASFMYDEARVLEILNATEAEIELEMAATIQYHKDFITERAGMGLTFYDEAVPVNDLISWKAEVQVIRDFVTDRLDNLYTDFQARYTLDAPENFEISSNDYAMGYVRVQSVKLREETMTGQFFKNMPIELIAEPNLGYQFSHWEGLSTSTNSQIDVSLSASASASAQIKAFFEPIPITSVSLHINEVQSKNDTTYADEFGEYNDWVEIYNFGTTAVDLAGFYLSDNPSITNKYQVLSGDPTKTTVPAGGFLVLWLDNDIEQGANHLGFKLSSEDEILLVNVDGVTLIDSLSFDLNADESYGSSTDGDSINYQVFTTPTPNATNNDTTLSVDNFNITGIIVYPNPVTNGIININSYSENDMEVVLFDLLGKRLEAKFFNNTLDISNLKTGQYFLKIIQDNKTSIKKIIIE